ncbi:spore germination protein KC [Melghirimyces profundicolus]|uniref:Spore germination protein KC n=1 Tax=Melghirimyces profundicolus TaxID=1242148 RepID=A0A2T6BTF6_9BACL|nr:Ger(x)C family spore germination protein [Melghirimyces profundicolus]PTX59343.1 spore germination protein KC [Melghirimyces profundicolus]
MKRLLSVFLPLCLLTTGCWDYRELDNRAVVMGMGIDKAEDGRYRISFQIANPNRVAQQAGGQSGGGGPAGSPVTTYAVTGSNITEAIRKATENVPRQIFLAHQRLEVISEAVAREGIGPLLDVMERDPQGSIHIPVLVVRGGTTAEAVLSTLPPLEEIPATKIYDQLKTHEEMSGETYAVDVTEVLRALTQKGRQPVLPGVRLIGDPAVAENMETMEHALPLAKVKLDGMAMFNRDGKLVGWMNGAAARGLAFINNKIQNTVVHLDCKGRKKEVSVEIQRVKTSIRPRWNHGKWTFHIHLTGEGNVHEVNCPLNLEDPRILDRLETQLSREVSREVREAVRAAQGAGTDVLGLGEALHRERPDLWKRWEKDWHRRFPKVKVQVSSTFVLRRTGMRFNPHQKEQ